MTYPLGTTGAIYALVALGLGSIFLRKAWDVLQSPGDRGLAKGLFKYSILYMMLLSAVMVVDSLPITHNLTAAVSSRLEPWMMTLLF